MKESAWGGRCLWFGWVDLIEYQLLMGHLILLSNQFIGLVGRVFANGPGDMGPIPGHFTQKQSKERSNALPYISV